MRNEDIDGDALSKQLASEARIRRLGTLDSFHVPEDWLSKYSDGFRRIAKEAKLPVELQNIATAEALVKTCIDPALAGETGGAVWDSRNLRWEKRRQEQ